MFSQLVKYATGNTKSDRMLNFSLIAYHSRILALTEKAWKDVQGQKDTSQTADERSQDIAIFAILVKFLT